jgi:hypothetical protein
MWVTGAFPVRLLSDVSDGGLARAGATAAPVVAGALAGWVYLASQRWYPEAVELGRESWS